MTFATHRSRAVRGPIRVLVGNVALVVPFLAADDSRMVTAQVVDGGWT